MLRHFIGPVCVLLAVTAALRAQEYRATLSGSISDPQGASVADAQVTVTNLGTGVENKTISNGDGTYTIPFLAPGSYTLKVLVPGFRPFQQGPIELEVNARMRVDVRLEMGKASSQVMVTAAPSLVETGSSDRGQVITGQQIRDLPANGKTPFNFMNLAPGVQYSGSNTTFWRPFDNGAINSYSINGGAYSRNEFQIDGVPDVAYTGESNSREDVAYVPPLESTQQFKVVTNSYDAQYGRTGGGIISVSTNTGTNQFHGVAYDYLERTDLTANVFSGNARNIPRSPNTVDQYGGTVSGPVRKDRTFFMFGIERYHQIQPQPLLGSVPSDAQRQGDFSQTLNAAGKLVTIYDPLTAHPNPAFDPARPVSLSNLQTLRDAFPGNRIPSGRMDPVALKVLQDIPAHNQAGDPVTGLNNWYALGGTLNDFQNLIARVDQTFNDRWRAYVRWDHNYRDGGTKNANGWNTPAAAITHNYRYNDGAAVNAVDVLSSSTVISATVGFNRFVLGSIHNNQDLSSLGFPAALARQVQLPNLYPVFTFENYLTAGTAITDITPSETYVANGAVLKVVGHHSLRFGAEYRIIHFADESFVNASGTYAFTHNWTSSNPQVNDPSTGNAIASFLLGNMSSGSAAINSPPHLTWRYPATFVQDDWQVNSRLTLNLGLRWDFESPPVERHNRQNRGFAFTTPNPIQAPGLNLTGGLLFAGVDQPRAAFNPDYTDWQPRLGAAYRISNSKPLVLRAGIGRYYLPTTEFGGVTGYSQTTAAQTTTATFLPFATLSNPFPNGLIQPIGASEGLATNAGSAVEFSDPTRRIPYVWQYSAGLQYEIASDLLLEASYVGTQTRRLEVSRQLDYLSVDQLALGEAYLSQSVPNPFYGILPANTTLGGQAKIARSSLLTPYPQFSSVLEDNSSIGKAWYNALQVRLQQRFRHGVTFLAAYTFSKNIEAGQFKNPQDSTLSRELSFHDVTHRLVISGIYDLPFGPGHGWLNHGIVSKVIGGWQVSAVATFQSGVPLPLPSGYYITGNIALSGGQDLNHWFNTSPNLWVVQPPRTLRAAPFYSPVVRGYTAPQVDATITRIFRITERQQFKFRVSAFNATNSPIFGFPVTNPASPQFGQVPITQTNLPRAVELGFRYSF